MNVVIKAGRILGCPDEPVLEDAYLVIEGDAISDIASRRPNASDCQEIDLGDCTILPGLVDAHVHLAMDPFDSNAFGHCDNLINATMRALANGESALVRGTTTVRDCGSPDGLVIEIAKAERAGRLPRVPRIIAAGQNICMTGGHGHAFGMEADGPDGVRKAVRLQLKKGADFIKVMSTGGVLTPGVEMGSPQFTLDELVSAAEEAHKAGKKVGTHAQASSGIANALAAGIDTIEHGSYISDDSLDVMKEQGTFFVATLLAAELQYEHRLELPEFIQKKICKHVELERNAVQRAIRAGVNMACGTDSGCPFDDHGTLPDQMELLVKMGMTPLQAIQTATIGSARALGIDDRVGEIAIGKLADIIAVEGNPADDIGDIRDIRLVMKGGQVAFKR